MLFLRKQRKVQEHLTRYNEQVTLCLERFESAFSAYFADPDREILSRNFDTVHGAERKADDIRREIEVLMYSKALFPESRGDILGLIEAVDKVPNQAESVVRMLLNQHICPPREFVAEILAMVDASRRCIDELILAVECLFSSFITATVHVGRIDALESEVDRMEEELIDRVFSTGREGFEKILLRDLIRRIANITDRAENAGDRIRIIVAKRSI